jgi:hypothetical protein
VIASFIGYNDGLRMDGDGKPIAMNSEPGALELAGELHGAAQPRESVAQSTTAAP